VTSRSARVIGVPTSAGAFAPGQEQAPAALRAAGFIEALVRAGLVVRDDGDCATWRWRPDRENRRAQNLPQIVAIVRDTAERVAAAANELTLVLGGDCTVGIGTVAGHARHGRVGLVYFDLHADLNVPSSVLPGALDWMGMAHMLGEDGAMPELAGVAGCVPLLAPAQVVLFGWGPEQAQPRERDAIGRLHLPVISIDEVSADPHGAAVRALALLEPAERLLVHFDTDVIDFTDTPLSENTGRNEGLTYAAAMQALEILLASPKLCGLTVTELNPAHVEEGAGSIERLARDLARCLSDPPR
jgi:arginase